VSPSTLPAESKRSARCSKQAGAADERFPHVSRPSQALELLHCDEYISNSTLNLTLGQETCAGGKPSPAWQTKSIKTQHERGVDLRSLAATSLLTSTGAPSAGAARIRRLARPLKLDTADELVRKRCGSIARPQVLQERVAHVGRRLDCHQVFHKPRILRLTAGERLKTLHAPLDKLCANLATTRRRLVLRRPAGRPRA
jgi:hypothetical protein